MKPRVVFHELAERELDDAATYYARARPGLDAAFIMEVRRAVGMAAENPTAGRSLPGGIRTWLVRRFPYSVLYKIREDHIRILAVAHQRRRPFYWRGRE